MDVYKNFEDKVKLVLKNGNAAMTSTPEECLGSGENEPKMQKLEEVLIKHFKACYEVDPDKKDNKAMTSTRAIVFSHLRDSVTQIVKRLKKHKLLKPKEFIGQSSSADGDKGMVQSEQQVSSVFIAATILDSNSSLCSHRLRSETFEMADTTCWSAPASAKRG